MKIFKIQISIIGKDVRVYIKVIYLKISQENLGLTVCLFKWLIVYSRFYFNQSHLNAFKVQRKLNNCNRHKKGS